MAILVLLNSVNLYNEATEWKKDWVMVVVALSSRFRCGLEVNYLDLCKALGQYNTNYKGF